MLGSRDRAGKPQRVMAPGTHRDSKDFHVAGWKEGNRGWQQNGQQRPGIQSWGTQRGRVVRAHLCCSNPVSPGLCNQSTIHLD